MELCTLVVSYQLGKRNKNLDLGKQILKLKIQKLLKRDRKSKNQ